MPATAEQQQKRFATVPAPAEAGGRPPIANGPRVSVEHHAAIRSRARKFFKEHEGRISQSQVGKLVGFKSGGAVISAYLNENYKGDNDGVARKLEQYMDKFDLQQAFGKDGAFADTTAVELIEKAIALAEATNGIARIVGVTGSGKTMTLATHAFRSGALHLFAGDGMGTARSVLAHLYPLVFTKMELGRRNTADAQRALIAELQNAPRTIMVDESEFASPLAAEALRCIADRVPCALIFAGEVWRSYSGAFEGRIVAELELDKELLTAADIAKVVGDRLPKDALEEVMPELLEEARTSGGFRRVHRILQSAQAVIGKGNGIDADAVLGALKLLRKAKSKAGVK
jgi:hypothetical protein